MSKKLHRVKKIGVMGMEKREKTVKLLTEAGIELADKAQGKRVERLKSVQNAAFAAIAAENWGCAKSLIPFMMKRR